MNNNTMILLQSLLGCLCLSVCIGNSSAMDGDITLQKLVFKNPSDVRGDTTVAGATVSIIFDVTPVLDGTDHTLAFIDESDKAKLLNLHNKKAVNNVGGVQSIDFELDTDDFAKIIAKKLSLELVSHLSGDEYKEGSTKINIPTYVGSPIVPTLEGKIHALDRRSAKANDIIDLRVANEVADGFVITGGDLDAAATCEASEGMGCYFMGANAPTDTVFTVCKDIAVDSAPTLLLCSETFTSEESTPTGFGTTIVTVDYKSNEIKIEATADQGSTAWEAVFHHGTGVGTDDPIKGADLTNIVYTATELGDHDILLVGLDSGLVKEFKKATVEDVSLTATKLGEKSTIIEVSINNVGDKLFNMKRNKAIPPEGDTSYDEVEVDCSEITDDSQCRGYFINLVDGTYVTTVKKITAPETIDNSMVYKSNEVEIKTGDKTDASDILIDSVETSISGDNIELDVCFKFVMNTSVAQTKYEFLAINSKGKWKKQVVIEEKDNAHACFEKIELSLEDFSENSKFLVLMRDLINGKLMASGEVLLKTPAPRAIIPEVDNGDHGSSSALTIVGAAIAGIACLIALVAAAFMFVLKINKDKDGLQYPLHRTNIGDSSIIHGLENPISTM